MAKKKAKKTEKACDIRFEDGPLDGDVLRVALPLPDVLKMNMGRDTYVQVKGRQTVFQFDPERSAPPTTAALFGDVG